ncbi:hypothetical protein ACQCN2_14465 [Brevibacillus ginsengisoli]|uniref:hypothetical protein n=1 Tax=Brevibacillus ginsengisoli TaxID=363854 RepID=UPI003CE7B9B6
MNQSNYPRKQVKTTNQAKTNNPGKSAQPVKPARPIQSKTAGQASGGALTKQEKELLEECLDELYEDYGTYRKSLKPGEEMNVTYQMFASIVKKLGLRQPK